MLVPRTVFNLHRITEESTRYALGAVRFERDATTREPLAIATDGRRLAVLGWTEPPDGDYPAPLDNAHLCTGQGLQLPAAACKSAASFKVSAATLKKRPMVEYTAIDESVPSDFPKPTVHLTETDGSRTTTSTIDQAEARFPQWSQCVTVATAKTHSSITIDARYLVEMVEVLTKHSPHVTADGRAKITLSLDAVDPSNSPLVMTVRNDDIGRQSFGLIMPVATEDVKGRHNVDRAASPRWLPRQFDGADITAAERETAIALAKKHEAVASEFACCD